MSIEVRGSVRERTARRAVPTSRQRLLGQHAVLPLPSRQADASPTRPYLKTADAMSSHPYPCLLEAEGGLGEQREGDVGCFQGM